MIIGIRNASMFFSESHVSHNWIGFNEMPELLFRNISYFPEYYIVTYLIVLRFTRYVLLSVLGRIVQQKNVPIIETARLLTPVLYFSYLYMAIEVFVWYWQKDQSIMFIEDLTGVLFRFWIKEISESFIGAYEHLLISYINVIVPLFKHTALWQLWLAN